jgi:hypothetical protein
VITYVSDTGRGRIGRFGRQIVVSQIVVSQIVVSQIVVSMTLDSRYLAGALGF